MSDHLPRGFAVRNGWIGAADLGRIPYAEAYLRQTDEVEQVLAWRAESDSGTASPLGTLLMVEHDPVVTISRRPGAALHLLATPQDLAKRGLTVEETDRGGDITYHGPGQLVVYPIVDLNRLNLRLHDYMRLLEQTVIDTLSAYGICGVRDPAATGVWVAQGDPTQIAKIAAMGVRVRRWVSMHGLSLNVAPDLTHFDLIVPCGLAGRSVTSMERLLERAPCMNHVKLTLAERFAGQLSLIR